MTTDEVPAVLLGIDEKTSEPPKSRLTSGASARALVQKAIREDEDRSRQRSLVQGIVAGNPPYNDGKRKAAGLSWTSNLNFMEAEGMMDSSAVPYYSIFAGAEEYAECRTKYKPDDPDHEQWNRDISRLFHCLLKSWDSFDWNVQAASYWMRLHGVGPCLREKVGDWRFRAIPTGNMLVPRKSASCVDKRLPWIIIRCEYSVVELWNYIKDSETAKALGYNEDAVKLAVKRASQQLLGESAANWHSASWEKFQDALTNHDLQTSYDSQDVACAHLFVQEFSGKISQFIVTESEVVPIDGRETKKDNEFLFTHVERYESYDEAITVFFQNIGNTTWHSVRGIADKGFKHFEVNNRLLNRIVDGAFVNSGIILQSTTAQTRDKVQLTQFGVVTLLPAGVELRQGQLSGFLEGPMAVNRLITNHLANNVGMFNQRTISREDGRGEQPTATQVNQQVAKESTLGQGQMTLFFLSLDKIYKSIFAVAADPNTTDEEAKEFQKACKEAGVPKQALAEMEYVRANRASGYGSPQMRLMTDQQMLQSGAVAAMPPEGQRKFWEDFTGGVKGAEKVRGYWPKVHVPDEDEAFAAMENAMVAMGRQPIVVSGQDNVIHLHSHFDDAAKTLEPVGQAIEQGHNDPAMLQQAYQYLQIMGPHCEEHLAPMRADNTRSQIAKMFEEQLKNLVAFSGKLRGAIISARREQEVAAQQQQQATALSALDQARVNSVQTHDALAIQKTQTAMRNQTLKTLNSTRLQQIKTASGIRNEQAKTEHQTDQAAA